MIDYNPFHDAVLDDPDSFYKQLRDESPAYYVEELDCWNPITRSTTRASLESLISGKGT